ncbi:MAG: hypothetical protein LC798_03025 [Chloroflexi bacterium]|nr:hypothetical protein [Chloroflexota bacterium]
MSAPCYEAAIRSAAAPSAGAAWVELRNGSARRVFLTELACTLGAATASTIGLIRATAQGAGGAATQVGLPNDPADTATASLTLAVAAFTTAPTFGSSYHRRFAMGAAVGAGFHWAWPVGGPLAIPASASLVVVAITAGAATSDWFAAWEE